MTLGPENVSTYLASQREAIRGRVPPKTRSLLVVVGFAVLYFLAGKLGLRFAAVHPSVTAVWPGTGIALAGILLLGYRVWTGIFLGAFVVNLTTAGSILSSLGIASGNTLEAVLAAYLVTLYANGRRAFDRAENIFKFALFGCLLATSVSATFGTASLFVTGFTFGIKASSVWSTWWLGDMVGAILVTPCFLLWSSRTEPPSNRSHIVRRVASFASLLLAGFFVFNDSFFLNGPEYPLKFLCIPFVVWAAFELHRHEVPVAMVIFSGIAIGSVVQAHGTPISNAALLVIQIFLGVAAMTGLLISAAVSERDRHEQKLHEARSELELRVVDRTRELEKRIEDQNRTEQALQDLSARLQQVQDQERRRIARELHDSTGQSLAILTMKLSELARRIARSDPKLSSQLEDGCGVARSISDELRTTSYLLHPPLLDEMGLQSALAWYVEGFQERSKIKTSLEVSENLDRMPADVEIMIFRVVQECLTNVHRHAKSETVIIRVSQSEGTLTLEVEDRGQGIQADKLKAIAKSRTTGVGLRGMRERVKAVGGELQILSNGTGTLVRSVVPLGPSPDTLPATSLDE